MIELRDIHKVLAKLRCYAASLSKYNPVLWPPLLVPVVPVKLLCSKFWVLLTAPIRAMSSTMAWMFLLCPTKVVAISQSQHRFSFSKCTVCCPNFSLEENVALPALLAGTSRSKAFAEARRLLEMLRLGDRFKHRPKELSGGEAQRGAVARALINNPSVVLADEPSGSLDSANRKDLHRLFFWTSWHSWHNFCYCNSRRVACPPTATALSTSLTGS